MKAFFFLLLVLAAVINCVDLDGDGYDSDPDNGIFQDCCDTVLDGCFDPYMVNPGAFEIPNNGINDHCFINCYDGLKCRREVPANLPCDFTGIPSESYVLSGPSISSAETEPAVFAIDLCNFKDDDDDPSWGFYRELNMVFALADLTRWGFDIGVIGPDLQQASVLRSFGRIGPYNGDYMLAMSSGRATAQLNSNPNYFSPDYQCVTDYVYLPSYWYSVPGDSQNFWDPEVCPAKPQQVWDSILARFSVVQPTNMGAFSIKALYLDFEFERGNAAPFTDYCDDHASWFLAFKNGSYGIPPDRNFAIDQNNYAFNSYNPNHSYYTQCADFIGDWPDNTCYDSEIHLESSNYYYASNWIPIGTAAYPGEIYELQFLTFDQTDQNFDVTVLLDDFKVMSEARQNHSNPNYISVPYGYQYTADVAMVSLIPDVKGVYPPATTTISLTFIVRNEGPEVAGDITISFTPPLGTSYNAITNFTSCTIFPASGDFVDNSFYKCKLPSNEPLPPHNTYYGTLTYNVLPKAPKDIHFRVTATTSSIDTVYGNNHLLQLVYIDK